MAYYNTNVTTLNLFFRCITCFAYMTFYAFYTYIQNIFWNYTGIGNTVKKANDTENYELSAHVCSILYRYKFDVIVGPSKLNNFLCIHEKFVHPHYVLKDNVTLYTADEKEAVFIEVDENVKVWKSMHGTFMREVQFLHAKKVIILPFSAFQRLASEIGPPTSQLVFICNVARCGSILTSRFFEESGRCVVLREADALNALAVYLETKPRELTQKIARSIISSLCKPTKDNLEPDAYVFKMTSGTINACSIIAETFPKCKILFCYRNAKNAAISLEKLTHKSPLVKIFYLLSNMSGDAVGKVYLKLARLGSPNVPRCQHPLEYGIHRWITSLKQYEQLHNELGSSVIAAIRYEDIIKNPKYFISEVFKFCNLSQSLVQPALRAMNSDSQENSCLCKKELDKYASYEFTPQLVAKCSKLCQNAGLPALTEHYFVSGLIALCTDDSS